MFSLTDSVSHVILLSSGVKNFMTIYFMLMAGVATRPGKVIGSVLRYNNCTTAPTEAHEQRRKVRNSAVSTQYAISGCPFPRRNTNCRSDRVDNEGVDGSNPVQSKPQYIPRKVAAAQDGAVHWY